MTDPEIILGFCRAGERMVIISPDGTITGVDSSDIFQRINNMILSSSGPQVITGSVDNRDKVKEAHGVLLDFVEKQITKEYGSAVVNAAKTTLSDWHEGAKRTFAKAPAGSSNKWRIRQRTRDRKKAGNVS